MSNIKGTLATAWRIAAPYFSAEDKWMGRGLLAAVVVIELAVVGLSVLFNRWNNVFYNALQERNYDVFTYQIIYFCVLAAIWIAALMLARATTAKSEWTRPIASARNSGGRWVVLMSTSAASLQHRPRPDAADFTVGSIWL